MKRRLSLFIFLIGLLSALQAQAQHVSGKVTDLQSGESLPGVAIRIKGTTRGSVTDLNGAYSVEAGPSDTLLFSFVGYLEELVPVKNRTSIDVGLAPDIETLSEVVVVGYGEQKKSVVTGSISSVKASDLESMPVNRIEQALQGRTSGLTIASSSGQPGSSATVRVRGITTLGNNDPLYVVDGVVVDNGGISYLNQSDIESIEVLKDAASQAIYGTRAAAGVIIVTTKKGKAGGISVNYNGFYGVSAPARRLDLLNATQYATLRNEAYAAGFTGDPASYQLPFEDPASYGAGTDWQKVIFNDNARRQNHELSLSGGNGVSTFYSSFGYLDQQGIVATDISNYSRLNLRLNSTHKLSKWFGVGQNLGYSYEKSKGIGNTNSEFGGPLSSAIGLDPITPLIETDPTRANASPYTNAGVLRDASGNPYGISPYVGQELTNPLAYIQTRLGNHGWSHNIVGNVYAELRPVEGLSLRSTLGTKLAFWGGESFSPISYLNSSTINAQTSFSRSSNQVLNWNLENTIAYSRSLQDHNFTFLLGQGAYLDENTRGVSLTKFNIPVDNFDDASMNYGVPVSSTAPGAYEGIQHRISSVFARLNYNYKEKYLLTAVARRDGSSRFGANYKYGNFPSASVGWVPSNESFWPRNNVVNFLKIRGGYGIVGNDAIGNFLFLSTVSPGRNYAIGNTGDYTIGYSPNAPSNPDLRWEETSQLNVGFESTLFKNLSLSFDWYKKETTGILDYPYIPLYIGAVSRPAANVSDMQNTGVELELGYTTRIRQVNFSLNGNVSYLQNKVTFLGNGVDFLEGGQGFQSSSYAITRTAVGYAANSFYGFRRLGIFQTPEDVLKHVDAEGKLIQPNAVPGDIIWADLNADGQITEADRTFIGNPTPKWSFGVTSSVAYKGFDLLVFGQGVAGNKIFQGLRRLDVPGSNWQTNALGRWTGPGTSNDYPRLTTNDINNNFSYNSDLYLEDGDYFRIKTLQLGYSLPSGLISRVGMQRLRVYVMSENLFTFTRYTGFDPEIGGGVMSIDRGVYPQARSFMLGVNVGF